MLINHLPLSFYVGKLARGETFSLTKHSDASLYCMVGDKGGDCNGCDYTPELRRGLIKSLYHDERNFFDGVQRLTDRDNADFDGLLSVLDMLDMMWHDTGIFASQFVDGGLYPLFEQLQKMRTVIVAGEHNRKARDIIDSGFIDVPASNSLVAKNDVFRRVQNVGPACYLFSCGMASAVFISELHGTMPDSWFIDVGHLWDAMLGIKSRHYMRDLTQDHIDRNLRPRA